MSGALQGRLINVMMNACLKFVDNIVKYIIRLSSHLNFVNIYQFDGWTATLSGKLLSSSALIAVS